MTDQTYLNDLVDGAQKPLTKRLLTAFRSDFRGVSVASHEYASRLRTIMEESLSEHEVDASSRTDRP